MSRDWEYGRRYHDEAGEPRVRVTEDVTTPDGYRADGEPYFNYEAVRRMSSGPWEEIERENPKPSREAKLGIYFGDDLPRLSITFPEGIDENLTGVLRFFAEQLIDNANKIERGGDNV